jgi:protein-tyrosine-phosphatase/predicted ATP-grasp superfamily ATP-dependent carboligase
VHAIARCLHSHGIVVDVGYPETLGQVDFTSRAVRQVHRLPDFGRTEAFGGALDELLERNGYDTLIPTTDESLVAITPIYGSLRRRLYPGCPAPEVVNAVLDKRITLKIALECGIDVPLEHRFRSLDDLDRARDTLRFPLLAKPASKAEEANFALRYFQTFEQLRGTFLDDPSFGCKNLLQEYCPGFGIGIEVLMWDGATHMVFQHQRLKELPSTGGVSILSEARSPDPALVEPAVRLLRRLNWQGVAMVEFRYDPATARAALMEVNGRYWGSLPLSVGAGVEFPYYEWQLAHGQVPTPLAGYRSGFRSLWRVGDLMRFISLIVRWKAGQETFRMLCKEGSGLVGDFCSSTKDALWQWSDPWPAIHEFQARILRPFLRLGMLVRLLPAGLARQCLTYRYYGMRHGLRHTSVAVRYALHLHKRNVESLVGGAKSFMFVCSGNIMRSPFAATLLKQYLGEEQIEVGSAGLFAKAGTRTDPTAFIAAGELGISLDDHRSSPVTAEMVEMYDLILVMDHFNEAVLLNRFPHAAPKTLLLGACSGNPAESKPKEILDPYGRGLVELRKCFGEVRVCVQTLSEWLRQRRT